MNFLFGLENFELYIKVHIIMKDQAMELSLLSLISFNKEQ